MNRVGQQIKFLVRGLTVLQFYLLASWVSVSLGRILVKHEFLCLKIDTFTERYWIQKLMICKKKMFLIASVIVFPQEISHGRSYFPVTLWKRLARRPATSPIHTQHAIYHLGRRLFIIRNSLSALRLFASLSRCPRFRRILPGDRSCGHVRKQFRAESSGNLKASLFVIAWRILDEEHRDPRWYS